MTKNYRSVKSIFPSKSSKSIKRIVFESHKNYMTFFSTYRYMAVNPLSKVKKILDEVDIVGKEHINHLYELNRPVVIVSIHMGDFFKGFLKLATLAPSTAEVGIIKWMNISKKETAAYSKFRELGANLKLFRLRDKPGLDAIRFLRRKNVLLTLCDIKSDLVKTTPVSFFDKTAHFPCGPAELAIAGQAIIMPVYTSESDGKSQLIVCEPIDTLKVIDEQASLSINGEKVTQLIVSYIENWIKNNPEQWHFWAILEELWEK